MTKALQQFFEEINRLPFFEDVDFSDINAVNFEGENALHIAVQWDDLEMASLLIENGISINQPGDQGYTPLHAACSKGNLDMVKLLVDKGADIFALSEGYPPFTTARFSQQDHICEFLSPIMKKIREKESNVYARARIKQLKAEIKRLERQIGE